MRHQGPRRTRLPTVSLLKNLKHANIVTLHDLIHTERSLTLVFEYLVSRALLTSPLWREGRGREGGWLGPCFTVRFPDALARQEWAKGPAPGATWNQELVPRLGLGPTQGGASCQGSGQCGSEPRLVFQDSDLKQYLDHCGNLMSMHNVKVRASTHLGTHLFSSPGWNPGSWLLRLLRPSNAGGREGAAPFREDREPWSALPCRTDTHPLPRPSG